MSNKFAVFSSDNAEVVTLSENNSVNNSIDIKSGGITREVMFNKVPYALPQGNGIAIIVINSVNKEIEHASVYDPNNDLNVSSMKSCIDGIAAGRIVILASRGAFASTQNMCDYMNKLGSTSWPRNALPYFDRAREISYACVINSDMKKITHEAIDWSFKPANINIIFDVMSDIGACGIPYHIVCDIFEHSSTKAEVNYHTFFDGTTKEAHLSTGDILYCTGSIKTSKAAWDAKNKTTIAVGQYNGNVLLTSTTIGTNTKPDTWETFEVYTDISSMDVNKISITGQRVVGIGVPLSGEVSVRNVHATQVSRKGDTDKNLAIGVNGIRSSSITDSNDYENPVMKLLSISSNNALSGYNISEIQ